MCLSQLICTGKQGSMIIFMHFCRGLIKWFTGEDIKLDEYLHPNLTLTYNRKRDYWNGYNPDTHQAVVEQYAKMEMVKKQLKADRLHQGMYVCIEE